MTEEGWRQEAIADHLGITQAAVSKILRRVDERALRVVADQVAYLKMRGARHLEYLSREGRRGWEQSKQGRVRRRQTKGVGLTAPRSSHKTSSSTNIPIPGCSIRPARPKRPSRTCSG